MSADSPEGMTTRPFAEIPVRAWFRLDGRLLRKMPMRGFAANAYDDTDGEFRYIEPSTPVHPAFPAIHEGFFRGLSIILLPDGSWRCTNQH